MNRPCQEVRCDRLRVVTKEQERLCGMSRGGQRRFCHKKTKKHFLYLRRSENYVCAVSLFWLLFPSTLPFHGFFFWALSKFLIP